MAERTGTAKGTEVYDGGDAGVSGAAPPAAGEAVSVEIYDQVYTLRGTDAVHIERLAALVDGKMRAVAAHGGTVDSLRVAVLAALNIGDELLALRERHDELSSSVSLTQRTMRTRAGTLAGMLDEVLGEDVLSGRRAG